MKAEELLSILISIEDELVVEYEKFCIGDITQETYKKRSEKIIQKQVNLINQFKEEVELKTLKDVQMAFQLQSDLSTKTHGYRRLCEQIRKLNKKQ